MKWIKVEDDTPHCRHECTTTGSYISNTVLISNCNEYSSIGFGHVSEEGVWTCYDGEHDFMNIVKVTHWMPIPELPKD